MTPEEFYAWMERVALGYLKWPPSEAYAATIHMIRVGLEGHVEMNTPSKPKKKPKASKDDIIGFARTHNALMQAGKMRPARKKKGSPDG